MYSDTSLNTLGGELRVFLDLSKKFFSLYKPGMEFNLFCLILARLDDWVMEPRSSSSSLSFDAPPADFGGALPSLPLAPPSSSPHTVTAPPPTGPCCGSVQPPRSTSNLPIIPSCGIQEFSNVAASKTLAAPSCFSLNPLAIIQTTCRCFLLPTHQRAARHQWWVFH